MELKELLMSEIEIGERFRTNYGDLEELALSIKEKELINPITVTKRSDGSYLLAAGGRRYAACKLLKMETIACRIYDKELSELELRVIELEENIKRKDLGFMEECFMKEEMLRLQQELHGIKTSTSPDASGVSLRDVASSIGLSHAQLSRDIDLAATIKAFPNLDWGRCKNKTEALKIKGKIEETFIRRELAKRVDDTLGKSDTPVFIQKLANAYIVGDFFTGVEEFPDGIFDLVEIDPPYAIELQDVKKNYAYDHEKYNEIDIKDYPGFMSKVFQTCYRLMSSNSWLICWHGKQWADTLYNLLFACRFDVTPMTACWVKPSGQTNQPQRYLASTVEPFFYARKGNAVIAKPGTSDSFPFPPVTSSKKYHPTERPIELMDSVLTTFGIEGSRVLVPFAGSGISLISAFKNRMIPIGFDLTSAYRNSYIVRIQSLYNKGEQS